MSTTTLEAPTVAFSTDGGPGRLRTWLRGHADDPSWYRPLLIALLAGTAIAYLINLTASGDANSFYAAAVQAGTKSWKAFFFGSLDSSNFITVDKPPASLWVMELSGRLFGFSSASMLIPEVLEGVVAVGLLAAAVKRWFGAGAGLLAGALLAITPVAALMFRFNNPDALMTCLLVASAYCLVRALDSGRATRWMLGVGTLLGFAFLAKMMEAFLVIPGFALVYVLAAPGPLRVRVGRLLAGLGALILSAGWWVTIVALWPASSRPMIDGSPSNSILNLIFDYNGLGRITGNESGTSVASSAAGGGGGGIGANFSGSTGVGRLFNDMMGSQASWLIPAALIVLVAGLIWRGRRTRTDRMRAGLLLWGSWLVVAGLTFSFSAGVIHTYYTVAIAPPIAALAGIGAAQLWHHRSERLARGLLALMIAVTAGWSIVLLGRDSGWESWLTPLIWVTGVLSVTALLVPPALMARLGSRVMVAVAVLAAVACLAAPVAYTAQTISTAHTGSTPTAGPSTGAGAGGFGGGGFAGGRGGFGGFARNGSAAGRAFAGGGGGALGGTTTDSALATLLKHSTGYRWAAATDGSQSAASLELASDGSPVMAIGGFNGLGGNISLAQFETYVKAGDIHYYISGGGGFGGAGGIGGGPGGAAGFGSRGTGATGSGSSAGLSSLFASGDSTGSGAPTGAPTGAGGFPGGSARGGFGRSGGPGASSSSDSAILTWVKAHYHSETVGGETIYNLADPLS